MSLPCRPTLARHDPFVAFAPLTRALTAVLDQRLVAATPGASRYHAALLALAPTSSRATTVLAGSGLPVGAFLTRFQRAALPSPKTALMALRFCYVGFALAPLGLRPGQAAHLLGFSSPQALSRAVRATTGLTPTAWRAGWSLEHAVASVDAALLAPYVATYRIFDPWVAMRPPAATLPPLARAS